MLLHIALRNLLRNRRRTLSSLLTLGVGVACLLLTAGFIRYSFDGLRGAIVSGGLGDFEVVPAAFGNAVPVTTPGPPSFSDWSDVRGLIESSPYVEAAGAAIQFAGLVTHGDRNTSFLGAATEPDRERRMRIELTLRSGRRLPDSEPVDGDDQVLLGAGLAHALAAEPGAIVTVMTATPDGMLNALDLTVAGVFSTGLQDLDDRILKTHLRTAQRLLGTDDVTSLVLRLKDGDASLAAESDLVQRLKESAVPLSLRSWETRAPFYAQVRALYSSIFIFLGAVVAALVTLSSSNALMMSVLERVREFGTLMAIGTTRLQLAFLVLSEAAWLGLFGAIVGSVLGGSSAFLINVSRLKMPPPPGAVDPVDLAVTVLPIDALWALAFVMAVVSVSAVPPMLRIFRLKIIEALGHV